MGAQRKLADPVESSPPVEAASVERGAPVDREMPRRDDGGLPTSPAILLQEQLAARLAETTAGPAEAQDAIDVPQVKWPMALRIVTIVALSLALWGGIVLTAVIVLT